MKTNSSNPTNQPSLFEECWKAFEGLPYFRNSIKNLIEKYGEEYKRFSEQHLNALFVYFGYDTESFKKAVQDFIRLTFDCLRMQNTFIKTGKIAMFTDEQRVAKVYENPELMEGPYLYGLYLAQIFWPNHYEKLRFFHTHFIPRLPSKGLVLDVGAGPGTYTIACRFNRPALCLVANDISPYSRPMVEGLHRARIGETSDKLLFMEGDFLEVVHTFHKHFDAAIFNEIIEHVSDPELVLQTLTQHIKQSGIIFFATATNAAFYDHTVFFKNVDQIETLLSRNSLSIEIADQSVAFQGSQDVDVVDYYAIIKKA